MQCRYLIISEGDDDDPEAWIPIVATSDPEVIRAALKALEVRVCSGTLTGDVHHYPAPVPE